MRSFFVFLACLTCTASAQLVTRVEERAAPATTCTTTAIPTPTNARACGNNGILKKPALLAQSSAVNQTVCRDKCIPDRNCQSFSYNTKAKVCKTYKTSLTTQQFAESKAPAAFWDKTCYHVQCCSAPKSICGDICANLKIDNNHCGECSNSCYGGQTCKAGKCLCPAGQQFCNGRCANLTSDVSNCGSCGNACPSGSTCVNGKCGCPAGYDLCNGSCVKIGTNDHCSKCNDSCNLGFSCQNGKCSCSSALETQCSNICVDLQTDYRNCGECGNKCLYNGYCSGGQCFCPTEGESYCEGIAGCHNLATDPFNCGTCGNECPNGQLCNGGACQCPDGLIACSTADGLRCIDPLKNNSNCGRCGNVCSRAYEFCNQGECQCPKRGRYGFPTTACPDRCAELQVEDENCGACGNKCGPQQTCMYGQCFDNNPPSSS